MKRSGKEGTRGSGENRGRDGGRFVRDRRRVKCWNCFRYGHYVAECRKPRREQSKGQKTEVNLTQASDNEPALLFTECGEDERAVVKLNEEKIRPVGGASHGGRDEVNTWYLDNGASNHMTGDRSRFKTLDEKIAGKVKFGDGSTVNIEGKGTVAFNCKNGEERILNEVYFIPTI